MALFAGTSAKAKPHLSDGNSEQQMSSPLLSETQQQQQQGPRLVDPVYIKLDVLGWSCTSILKLRSAHILVSSDRNAIVRESWLKDPLAAQVCVAAGVRNAGGCVFGAYAYVRGADDSGSFFGPRGVRKVSNATLANFMTWIPFLGGSAGVLMGGYWLKRKRRASEHDDGCGEVRLDCRLPR